MTNSEFSEHKLVSKILSRSDPLERQDITLAMVAAVSADGNQSKTERVYEAILQSDGRANTEELREAILQTHIFCGFPRALNALAAFRSAWKSVSQKLGERISLRSTPLEENEPLSFLERGKKLYREIYGRRSEGTERFISANSPDITRWMVEYVYGQVLARPLLSAGQRSLCICASLIPMNVPAQLESHIRGALNTGSSVEQLRKLYESVAELLSNNEVASAARRVFQKVLDD